VQLDCRVERNLEIGQYDLGFGPTCAIPTMPVSLTTFDVGTFDGFIDAREHAHASTMLCVCTAITCSEKNMIHVTDEIRRIMVDEAGKRMREGVLRATNQLASHECLNATVGVELYKTGFVCGYLIGVRSQTIRKDMEDTFLKVMSDNPPEARRLAADCFARFIAPPTEAGGT
jgi:hypothetical protein